jgi:hypothetical protein
MPHVERLIIKSLPMEFPAFVAYHLHAYCFFRAKIGRPPFVTGVDLKERRYNPRSL